MSVPTAPTGAPSTDRLTVRDLQYSPLLKTLNTSVRLLQSAGILPGTVTADGLKRAAMRNTGFRQFGPDFFEEPLARLAETLPNCDWTPLGKFLSHTTMAKALGNRLRVEDYIARHPAVTQISVSRPIFVLGFPRTGTTLLQNLLALDDGYRTLKFWELQSPAPVHPNREKDRKKRILDAHRTLQIAYLVAPEQRTIHEIQAESPEECWPLFSCSSAVLNYDLVSGLTDYGAWLMDYDMTEAYAYYRRILQVLSHNEPEARFLLKCPEHLWFIDALLAVFPDARIIWTHRDPVASVASYCSLISLGYRMLYGRIDPIALGRHIEERFLQGVNRAMDARDRSGKEDQFFDVDFQTLVRDPAKVVRDIKAWADMPHDNASEARIDAWLESERADKRGAHVYSAELYDLDIDAIHRDYATYINRFSIPVKKRKQA